VGLVALEQRRYALTISVAHRDVQQQVTIPERRVVDHQRRPDVAEPLQGSHHPGLQPVVAAILIQDACSLLTAQDLSTAATSAPADSRSAEMAGISDLSVSRPTTSPAGR
jgi:hypothetical protein